MTTLLLALALVAPPTAADLLTAREFGIRCPTDLPPDGRRVAYTLADPARQESTRDARRLLFAATGASQETAACDVWVTDLSDGKAVRLGDGTGTSWGGVWSPDGNTLAFYSDRDGAARVWLWDAVTGKTRPPAEIVARPLFGFEMPAWTPDGRGLVVKVMPDGETVEIMADRTHGLRPPADVRRAGAATVEVFRGPPTAVKPSADWTNRYLCDLAVLDLAGGVRRIARGVKPIGVWLAPSGDAVAFADFRELSGPAEKSIGYDLRLASAAGGAVRTLATGVPSNFALNVSWSPDGKTLAYQHGGLAGGTGDCFVVPAAGGDPVHVTPAPHPSFDSPYRPPLWTADGKFLLLVGGGQVWAADVAARTVRQLTTLASDRVVTVVADGGRAWSPDGGTSAVLLTRDAATQQMAWQRLDVAAGTVTRVWGGERRIAGGFQLCGRVTPAGPRLVFAAEGAAQPPDLYQLAFDGQPPRRVTTINPQFAGRTFGGSQTVRWKSATGADLAGTLLLPADHKPGQRHPLVVRVYPNDTPSTEVSGSARTRSWPATSTCSRAAGTPCSCRTPPARRARSPTGCWPPCCPGSRRWTDWASSTRPGSG